MAEIAYIRMKKYVKLTELQELKLKHIAHVTTSSSACKAESLLKKSIYTVTEKDSNYVVLDGFLIIRHLNRIYPDLEIQLAGPAQTVVHVETSAKKFPVIVVIAVWLILFIGAAMTIMNFHYDVSMQAVQQKLHYFFTGRKNDFPLWIQVPYSFGIGLGMLLFFNQWFKKRFNEEPSPLEIEIFKYQQSLNDYIIHHENPLDDSKFTD